MTRIIGMSLLLCACSSDKGTDTDTTDTNSSTDDRFSEYVYVTEAPTGDHSCFTGGADANEWTVDTLADDVVQSATMSGEVIDFETDDPVEEATVDIFFSNSMSGSADLTAESDSAGSFSASGFLTCTPYAYRTYTDPALGNTKVTIQANRIEGNSSDISNSFNSVSAATYAVIPSLLGVSPDVDKGVVAGTAYDCNGDAYSGAQVVVRDADGNIPESLVVKYFVDNFPNRNQEWTSDDGLFVAINVPEGDWIIETWVSDGAGGHLLMGEAPVQVYADSINLSNVYVGYNTAFSYPDSCLGDAPVDTGDPGDTGDTGSTGPIDADGDGVGADVDCDDNDASVGGERAWYADTDGDSYGDPESAIIESCTQPSGHVIDNTDCDDSNSDINPGATEVPDNGVDENCDPSDDTTTD